MEVGQLAPDHGEEEPENQKLAVNAADRRACTLRSVMVQGRPLGLSMAWKESLPLCLLGGALPPCFHSIQLTVTDQLPGVLTLGPCQ